MLRQAQAQGAGGLYGDAQRSLAEAAARVGTLDDARLAAAVEAALGNLLIALGPPREAERRLRHALELAERAGAPAIAAAALNNLGNLATAREEHAAALEAYTGASERAAVAGRIEEQARALANEARAWLALDAPDRAEVAAGAALELAGGLPDGHRKAYLLLHVGRSFARLAGQAARAADLFERAARLAGSLGDARAGSYAAGYRGGIYEAAGRYPEALDLTRRALLLAQRARAPESLYLWHWQAGRLLRARGETAQAIEAYRAAVGVLAEIRYELNIGYGSGGASFREAVGPVFFELVDLLMQRADDVSDEKEYQALLAEARDTVEELKAAELRDYFQDECVDTLRSKLQAVETV